LAQNCLAYDIEMALRYDGPNRLIVSGEFCFEGSKMQDTPGYELSIVHNDEEQIRESIEAFDRVFGKAKSEGSTKLSVIEEIKSLSLKYSEAAVKTHDQTTPSSAL
jgi:hypothetical protein